jgi:hypothetical protein
MPFVYRVGAGNTSYSTHATPSTEDAVLALKQATRGFMVQAFSASGRGAGLTALSGISFASKRWTTAGSGGTALTPVPVDDRAPAAATTAADKQTALTPGTTSGAIVCGFGCGVSSQGGWVARDPDSMIRVDAGTADEISTYSICGTASIPFVLSAEIVE